MPLSEKAKLELEAQLEVVMFKRDDCVNKIETLYALSQTLNVGSPNITAFQSRVLKIDHHYDVYSKSVAEIIKLNKLAGTDPKLDSLQKQSIDLDEKYFFILSLKSEYLPSSSPPGVTPPHTNASQQSINLPRINLPVFDGTIRDWPTFKDTYVSLIHNQEGLTNVQKFHYLLSSTKFEAHSLAKTLPVTDDNYHIIWNKLIDRYDNKRLMATYYFDEICNLKSLQSEDPKSLRQVIDSVLENKSALQTVKPTDLDDFFFFNLTLRKLDMRTRQLFEESCSGTDIPTFQQLIDFLNKHCLAMEIVHNQTSLGLSSSMKQTDNRAHKAQGLGRPIYSGRKPDSSRKSFVSSSGSNKQTCLQCSGPHLIHKCSSFTQLTPDKRRDFIRSKQACFNCLSNSHMRNSCPSKSTCRICAQRHHTLVHEDKSTQETPPLSQMQTSDTKTSCTSQTYQGNVAVDSPYVLLGTVQMLIQDSSGKYQTIRGLVDSGSQVSCISEACVQRLGLPRSKYHIPIMGLSQVPVSKPKGIASCTLKPANGSHSELNANAVILPRITNHLPIHRLKKSVREQFQHLLLADENFDYPSSIDFLIGADIFPSVFDGARLQTPTGLPTLYHSIFGWVLLGAIDDKFIDRSNVSTRPYSLTSNLCLFQTSPALDDCLKRFWELEESPKKQVASAEDQFCEQHFKETHTRDQTGRYVVKLPFKVDNPTLGDSFSMALQRFECLERKLDHSPELKKAYHDFMSEYEELGHMTLLPVDYSNAKYFIPHHGIYKTDTQPPKFRTVFDGSAKTSSGESLNDKLFSGPKLQRDITDIICRFRLHKIVFTTDVCKMFRQVLMHIEHQPYQIILWRFSSKDPVKMYALNTLTYGLTPSPFLAMRSMQQLAADEGQDYPSAAKVISNDMFVDDVVTGASTLCEAQALKSELITIFSKAGLELKKWSSNSTSFLAGIPIADQDKSLSFDSDQDKVKKILGLKWLPTEDVFTYDVEAFHCSPTKRRILSQIARIFDPLGWLTPTVLSAKLLIQTLWTEGIDWDDVPSAEVQEKWNRFMAEFPQLKEVFIPRLILPEDFVDLQLHGFSDASEKGYAGVVYLRVTCKDQSTSTHLVIAKSKVSPLKRVSIPRLELCAALLVANLLEFCKTIFLNHSDKFKLSLFAWTDSTVVLNWLHTSPHLLKTFIANRVSTILDKLNPSQWYFTSGTSNPADCASRGISPSELVNHPLWWHGPPWILEDCDNWPKQNYPINLQNLPEIKEKICNVATTSDKDLLFLQDFSSLSRLKRITAWSLRFMNNCRRLKQLSGPLMVSELNDALTLWIKQTQQKYFHEDLLSLQNKGVAKTIPLVRLDPFLDSSGVIRVGGRIRHSSLQYPSKHPVLLPKTCHLTVLIIDFFHITHLHAGPKLLQSVIAKQFWIFSARSAIRKRLSKCLKCVRFRAALPQPFMSDLPASRLQSTRPFLSCGVDFAGPYQTKSSKLRKPQLTKSYLCIFICMSTKAVHLEAVSGLSAEDFLASFTRFISRRGLCKDVYSDMGTNFVAAAKTLTELHKHLKSPSASEFIQKALAEKNITWHFNPPLSPHFGGLWEAAVKSAKFHLKRVIGDQTLTFEELATLFTQVEAVLNSRPLCALSTDPNDTEVLTPGHFLIGDSLTTPPYSDITHLKIGRLSRWQFIQQATQHFWRQWHNDYLHTLQQRGKWTRHGKNLQEGDLVLIKEANVPPLHWPMGRVMTVHPGKDKTVRVVTVRTASGQLVRPVVKLCPLPVE